MKTMNYPLMVLALVLQGCLEPPVTREASPDAPPGYRVEWVFSEAEGAGCLSVDSYLWIREGEVAVSDGYRCQVDEDEQVLVTWFGPIEIWSNHLGWRHCTPQELDILELPYCEGVLP